MQQPQTVSMQTQLKGAVQQYNQLVDIANSNSNAPRLEYWNTDEEGGLKTSLDNLFHLQMNLISTNRTTRK
jgi:hypothetical protein